MEIIPELIKILTPLPLLHKKVIQQFTCRTQEKKKVIFRFKIFLSYMLSHSQLDLIRSSGLTVTGDREQLSQSSSCGSTQHAPTRLWVIVAAALFRSVNSAFPHFYRPFALLRESEERCPGRWRATQKLGTERRREERRGRTQQKPAYQRARPCRLAQILVKILWSPEGENRWSEILCWGLERTCHCLHL